MVSVHGAIQVVKGPDKGKSYLLCSSEARVIGRGAGSAVKLTDKTVSAAHAELRCIEGIWFVDDLESRHGTYVNEERTEGRKALFAGDRIRAGKTLLEFQEHTVIPASGSL